MTKNRDNFPLKVIKALERRVNGRCSNPEHRVPTSGPKTKADEANCIGVAAHIAAAAPGGPRYDPDMTPEQRKDIANAIWLCANCSIMIDKDPQKYTVGLLRRWKQMAEQEALDEMGNVPISRKTHEHLQAVVFGELPKKRIPDAVATMCRLSAKALEELDPRFSVEVAHQSGQTSYIFNAKEPVNITARIADGFGREFSEKLNALIGHGKDLEIDSTAITFEGSPLIEINNGKAGTFVLSSTLRKEAINKITILDDDGRTAFILDDVIGEVLGGSKSITFSGKTFGGLLSLEYGFPLHQEGIANCTTTVGIDYSIWRNKTLLSLPYFDKIYRFYQALYHGEVISLRLEIEGNEVVSGKGANFVNREQITGIFSMLRYTRNVRAILKLLKADVPYVENVQIPSEDVEDLEYLYNLLFEYNHLRGEQIGPVMLEVIPHDTGDIESSFNTLISGAASVIRIEQTYAQPLNLFGTEMMLPGIAMNYSEMKLLNAKVLGEIKVGEAVSLELHPSNTSIVQVELCTPQLPR